MCRALLNSHLHALAPNQQTTSMCILLRQVPTRRAALLMVRGTYITVSSMGVFFGQTSVMANMGANPSLLQTSPLLVLAVGCSGTVCTMPTAKTTKVFRSITKQCFPIPTVSFNVFFCGKVVSRKIIVFSENVSMLKAELTFKSHQFKVINWSNSSGIDCPRKALWCACINAPLQNK